MNNFTGLKGVRRILELLLKKLSSKETMLTEIEEEELRNMYNAQTGTDLDLSWIASQESVSNVDAKVEELKGLIVDAIEKVDTAIALCETNTSKIDELNDLIVQIGSKNDPSFGGYHVAAVGVLMSDWEYVTDDDNKIVTLNTYKGEKTDVVVYDKYELDGLYYKTRLDKIPTWQNTNITSIKIWDKIINEVTSLSEAFNNQRHITTIDFGKSFIGNESITSMHNTFTGCSVLDTVLNFPSSKNVTDMAYAFASARCPVDVIKQLDTSSVEYMNYMFSYATADSVDLSAFDTSNVKNMCNMFDSCNIQSINVTGFKFDSIEHSSLSGIQNMFNNSATNKNSPKNIIGLNTWDTKNITNMYRMFNGCSRLEHLDVSGWDTSSVTDMSHMFNNMRSSVFETLDLTSFNIHNVTTMRYMFYNCTNLKEILVSRDKWVISDNCDTTDMFDHCGTTSVTYVD